MSRRANGVVMVIAMALLHGCACEGPAAPPDAALDAAPALDAQQPVCGVPGSTGDGAPCACDADCVGGAVCWPELESGHAGGTCARLCSTGPCSAGATCWAAQDQCFVPCASDADCPARRSCNTSGYCVGYCFADEDCDSGFCDRERAQCTDGTTLTGAPIGSACTAIEDCASRLCALDVCVAPCSAARDLCPEGSRRLPLADDRDAGLCFLDCRGAPCPSHLVCASGLCLPPT